MTEEKINSMSHEFSDAVEELAVEVDVEFSHGAGFGTKQDRKEFIEYFDKKFKNVNKKYEALKVALNSLKTEEEF